MTTRLRTFACRWGSEFTVLAVFSAGCLAVADVELADVTGEWRATQARFAEPGNLNNTIDLIELNWEIQMTVKADGAFTLTLQAPDQPPDLRSGTVTVENGKDVIFTRAEGTVGEGEVFVEDDQMALMFDHFAGIQVDINRDGTPIPVTLLLVLERT